jgi:hypothetical protein
MVVIDVLRIRFPAYRAPPALRSDHLKDVSLGDAVTTLQVVVAGAAVVLGFVLAASIVVTRQAVVSITAASAPIPRELVDRFFGLAV